MGRAGARRAPSRDEAGASAVEFAVVLPLLLLFIFGIIEFGLAFNRVQSFEAAAREAARLGSVGYDTGELENPTPSLSTVNWPIRRTAASTVAPEHVEVDVVDDEDCVTGSSTDPGDEERRSIQVAVRIAPAHVSKYRLSIPVPGGLVSDLDYEAIAEFRCEVRP